MLVGARDSRENFKCGVQFHAFACRDSHCERWACVEDFPSGGPAFTKMLYQGKRYKLDLVAHARARSACGCVCVCLCVSLCVCVFFCVCVLCVCVCALSVPSLQLE